MLDRHSASASHGSASELPLAAVQVTSRADPRAGYQWPGPTASGIAVGSNFKLEPAGTAQAAACPTTATGIAGAGGVAAYIAASSSPTSLNANPLASEVPVLPSQDHQDGSTSTKTTIQVV